MCYYSVPNLPHCLPYAQLTSDFQKGSLTVRISGIWKTLAAVTVVFQGVQHFWKHFLSFNKLAFHCQCFYIKFPILSRGNIFLWQRDGERKKYIKEKKISNVSKLSGVFYIDFTHTSYFCFIQSLWPWLKGTNSVRTGIHTIH